MDQTYEFEELCIHVSVGDNGTDVRTYWIDGSCQFTVKPGWHGSDDEPASSDYIDDINNIVIDKIYDVVPEAELCFSDDMCKVFLDKVLDELDKLLRNDVEQQQKMLYLHDQEKEELVLDYALSNIKDF